MRICIGLTALLLLGPVADAASVEPTFIRLHGHKDVHVVLEWEVHGGDLVSLDLVRVLDDAAEVIPLDPESRSYNDTRTPTQENATYFLVGAFANGVTASNAYESNCEYAGVTGGFPPVFVEPRCIKDVPLVSDDVQYWVRQAVVDLLPGT